MSEISLFWVIVLWHGLLGVIVGSFLNVVIYRFNTGKSLNGRSRCLSCGKTLGAWHLVPVMSYLMLRGRCAYCCARISPRYVLIEVATGVLFGLLAVLISEPLLRGLYLVLASLFVLIIVYDILHTIIPDLFVVLVSLVALGIVGLTFFETRDTTELLLRVLAAVFGFLAFFSLWYVSSGRWIGLGDAKLAVPLGFLASWPGIISALILSFWIGAAVGLLLLCAQYLLRRGQQHLPFLPHSLTIKSEIPFAPFLLLGFALVHFYHVDVFTLIGALVSYTTY